ncbi:hypothetical protein ACQR1I_36630 [Bradyrhizobium sp. HKCCYLS2038]|uniref:hypothetical protein n=1 Tax=Bradyrhizobium sp. HKCCYLS2038 TaxID=3420764 RepID=UPI003EB6A4D7
MVTTNIEIGQIYRDTYFDGLNEGRQEYRTIKITAIEGEKAHAITLTDCLGNPSTRRTRVSFKTLRNGYVLVSPRVAD